MLSVYNSNITFRCWECLESWPYIYTQTILINHHKAPILHPQNYFRLKSQIHKVVLLWWDCALKLLLRPSSQEHQLCGFRKVFVSFNTLKVWSWWNNEHCGCWWLSNWLCTLGGVGIKPYSIRNYTMLILSAKYCTGKFSLINLGEVVSVTLLEWNDS